MRNDSDFDGNNAQRDAFDLHYDQIDISPLRLTTGLPVIVPYTTPELTRIALRYAAASRDLGIHICLVDLQVMPFRAKEPLIYVEVSGRLDELLEECGVFGQSAVLYANDRIEGFNKILKRGSLVVLATKKTWWPTREKKLARALTKAGHQVILLHAGCS